MRKCIVVEHPVVMLSKRSIRPSVKLLSEWKSYADTNPKAQEALATIPLTIFHSSIVSLAPSLPIGLMDPTPYVTSNGS
jgi:hypothetical protein